MAREVPFRSRIDFSVKVLNADDETHTLRVALEPDPRRYRKTKKDGKTLYVDKYLGYAFGTDILESMAAQMVGTPLSYSPPTIKNALEYSEARKKALQHEVATGEYVPPSETPDQHRFPGESSPDTFLTFVSLDICGATKLRAKHGEHFDRAFEFFLNEMGTVVGQFHGSILKHTGDGFISFLDSQSINSQCDNAIDMGLTFLAMLHKTLNPTMKSQGLPKFAIRVGADHGSAVRKKFVVRATRFETTDIASDALNRAVKIQEAGKMNQFWIGRGLYEQLHVQWLQRCHEVKTTLEKSLGVPGYKVYRVD